MPSLKLPLERRHPEILATAATTTWVLAVRRRGVVAGVVAKELRGIGLWFR